MQNMEPVHVAPAEWEGYASPGGEGERGRPPPPPFAPCPGGRLAPPRWSGAHAGFPVYAWGGGGFSMGARLKVGAAEIRFKSGWNPVRLGSVSRPLVSQASGLAFAAIWAEMACGDSTPQQLS